MEEQRQGVDKPGAVPGWTDVLVGHAQDEDRATGCTVILVPRGAVAGADVRGGAPGTRETDLTRPENTVSEVHAVLLAGGSAFGLEAASGVMRWLADRNVGFDTGVARVPIVLGAVLFDLALADVQAHPDAAMGYAACETARHVQPCAEPGVAEGCVGAGTGATVGKLLGMDRAVKAGIGCATEVAGGLCVQAWVAVNAVGEVVDEAGNILAGIRGEDAGTWRPALEIIRDGAARAAFGTNTSIGCVITNARLTKAEATKVAQMAHDGLARAIRPVHTPVDGDTLYALSLGGVEADVLTVGSLAAEAVAAAVRRAVRMATPLAGLPSVSAWRAEGGSDV